MNTFTIINEKLTPEMAIVSSMVAMSHRFFTEMLAESATIGEFIERAYQWDQNAATILEKSTSRDFCQDDLVKIPRAILKIAKFYSYNTHQAYAFPFKDEHSLVEEVILKSLEEELRRSSHIRDDMIELSSTIKDKAVSNCCSYLAEMLDCGKLPSPQESTSTDWGKTWAYIASSVLQIYAYPIKKLL